MAILKCTCEHEFQDKTYGKGKRVMNPTLKGRGIGAQDIVYRCTVCHAEHRSYDKYGK